MSVIELSIRIKDEKEVPLLDEVIEVEEEHAQKKLQADNERNEAYDKQNAKFQAEQKAIDNARKQRDEAKTAEVKPPVKAHHKRSNTPCKFYPMN